ncbi:MAG TPA: hypothetical protein VKD71_03250 [Gemmataceae bacterium]|nr:hypothetical protein [Gemmataceae bacterium]
MWKRVLCAAALAAVFLGTGSGCRLFCDRYCDRRDRDCCDHPRHHDPCADPCYNPPPVRYDHGDNCR